MLIDESDVVFEVIPEGKGYNGPYSYFGWEFGLNHSFKNYIIGYKDSCSALYEEVIKQFKIGNIEKQDTLIYPLCFLYRHTTELFIKYLFCKHVSLSENESKDFFNKNHNLEKAWEKLEVFLIKLEINQSMKFIEKHIDLKAVHAYVLQIQEFDDKSMRMRYPVTKKLQESNEHPIRLKIFNLNEKMISLFDTFERIDSELDEFEISFLEY